MYMLTVWCIKSNAESSEFRSRQESSTGEASTDGRTFRVAQACATVFSGFLYGLCDMCEIDLRV